MTPPGDIVLFSPFLVSALEGFPRHHQLYRLNKTNPSKNKTASSLLLPAPLPQAVGCYFNPILLSRVGSSVFSTQHTRTASSKTNIPTTASSCLHTTLMPFKHTASLGAFVASHLSPTCLYLDGSGHTAGAWVYRNTICTCPSAWLRTTQLSLRFY